MHAYKSRCNCKKNTSNNQTSTYAAISTAHPPPSLLLRILRRDAIDRGKAAPLPVSARIGRRSRGPRVPAGPRRLRPAASQPLPIGLASGPLDAAVSSLLAGLVLARHIYMLAIRPLALAPDDRDAVLLVLASSTRVCVQDLCSRQFLDIGGSCIGCSLTTGMDPAVSAGT